MLRELIYSMIGHSIVLSGLVFPSFLVEKPQPHVTIYQVKTVSMQSIEQLLEKSALRGKPKPKIPQVDVKPDKTLPKKSWRKKQTVKQKSTAANKHSTTTDKGKTSEKKSPVAGIEVDTEFDNPEYLMEMRNRIFNNWQCPMLKKSVKTRVYFKLGKDGKLLRAFVKERAGNMAFDTAAINAVIKSAPLPPLPENFPEKELGVTFDFIYDSE